MAAPTSAVNRPVDRSKGVQSAEIMEATGGVHLGGDVWIFSVAAALVDGTSGTGAGITGPGSICGNSSDGKAYINTNTKASPTWTVIGTQT